MGITEEALIYDITQQLSDTGKSREVLFNSSSSNVYMWNISLFQTILMRDSNFASNTDAKLSDPVMPCVYMHQAFDQNNPFWHAQNCLIFQR